MLYRIYCRRCITWIILGFSFTNLKMNLKLDNRRTITERKSLALEPSKGTVMKNEKIERKNKMSVASLASESVVEKENSNPYKISTDADIFVIRDEERRKQLKEKEEQKLLPIHQRLSYSCKVSKETALSRKAALNIKDDFDKKKPKTAAVPIGKGIKAPGKIEKEAIATYIRKKREMFLLRYALDVKRNEMTSFDRIATAEEFKIQRAERYLEDDASEFDSFISENDRNSVLAVKMAEDEARAKMEKGAEIKAYGGVLMNLKSQISKKEEMLKNYMQCKTFLEDLTPLEWIEARQKRGIPQSHLQHNLTANKKIEKRFLPALQTKNRTSTIGLHYGKKNGGSSKSYSSGGHPKSRARKTGRSMMTSPTSIRAGDVGGGQDEVGGKLPTNANRPSSALVDSDEEVELYFTDPKQLLNIYYELEENNLCLIINMLSSEALIDELRNKHRRLSKKMNEKLSNVKSHISNLERKIAVEEERCEMLEIRCSLLSYCAQVPKSTPAVGSKTGGKAKGKEPADEEGDLEKLDRKIEEVYRSTLGENEANLCPIQMLTEVECRLQELLDSIDQLPPDVVKIAEKEMIKIRRARARDDKMDQQRRIQEERNRKASLRKEQGSVNKPLNGRKLVPRSPPLHKKKESKKEMDNQKEWEELYYFT